MRQDKKQEWQGKARKKKADIDRQINTDRQIYGYVDRQIEALKERELDSQIDIFRKTDTE